MEDFSLSISATAPVVGRHKKSQSLVGYDPLLQDELRSGHVKGIPTDPEDRDTSVDRVNQEELCSELRAIASELSQKSPSRSLFAKTKPENEEKHEDKATPLTPVRASSRPSSRPASRVATPTATPPSRFPRLSRPGSTKKQSQHSRTRSLPAALTGASWITKKSPARSSKKTKPNTPGHSRNSSRASLSSDMMQELWEMQDQNQGKISLAPSEPSGELCIPSLAKPRPTSFLTGREVVLSSEADATEWQLEIPDKTELMYTCRASWFLETYQTEKGKSLDLAELIGCTSGDLAMFVGCKPSPTTNKLDEAHRPAVESLLECGTDLLQVQGYIKSNPVNGDPASFRQVFILERQRQFLCIFRGTSAEQQGKLEKQPHTVKLSDNKNVSVFADRYKAFQELELQLFGKLDQLMEDNPFCDFVFAGHGFGAAMATLAAYRYAWARPELRVAATVTGNVKVGLPDFRLSANSLPNLKLVRVELGHSKPANTAGVHAGHTIRINPMKTGSQVKAFKFSDDCKSGPSPVRKFRLNKEKVISEYVDALDDLGDDWVKDFYRQDGAGVKGKDNETRLVV